MASKNQSKKSGNGNAQKARADLARETAARLRAQQAQAANRQRIIFGAVIVAIVVALVAVVAFIVVNNPNDPNKIKNDLNAVAQPNNLNDDYSFTVSARGGGKSAEIPGATVLDIYNDFMCPSCGNFERTNAEGIDKIIESGKVNVHFHPLGFLNNTSPLKSQSTEYAEDLTKGQGAPRWSDMYSTRAAAAAYYIMQNAPDKYYDFVSAMYRAGNQPCEGYKDEGDSRSGCTMTPVTKGYDPADGTNQKIQEHIIEAGISPEIAAKATNGEYRDFVEKSTQFVFSTKEVSATPYIGINGRKWYSGEYDKENSPSTKPNPITDYWSTMSPDQFADYVINFDQKGK